LEIQDEKAKSVIAFLKQLDFVKIKLSPAASLKKKIVKPSRKTPPDSEIPYFNTCPQWDTDASILRHGGSRKRVKEW